MMTTWQGGLSHVALRAIGGPQRSDRRRGVLRDRAPGNGALELPPEAWTDCERSPSRAVLRPRDGVEGSVDLMSMFS